MEDSSTIASRHNWGLGIPSKFASGQALRLRLFFALRARRTILAQDDRR